jgi:hypothetical protein
MISLVIVAAVVAMIVAANRYAARRQRNGEWGPDGPHHPLPTRPAGADLYNISDGGLRRAWEQQHGPEGYIPNPPREMPPILPPLDDSGAAPPDSTEPPP